ncbi:MAG: lysophospholipid acyltransferase family protein, partial [Nocardioidaceae bacterium]
MRDRTYRVVIAAFRLLFAALGLRLDVRDAERLPADGPAVVASNHVGYLDFTFVGLVGTRRGRFVRFMAKSAVFDSRVSGPLMRAMRHIPVVRAGGAGAYRQALRALDAGEVVGVFPESTISRSW